MCVQERKVTVNVEKNKGRILYGDWSAVARFVLLLISCWFCGNVSDNNLSITFNNMPFL